MHLVLISLASIASSWKILLWWRKEDKAWQPESSDSARSRDSGLAHVSFSLNGELWVRFERREEVEPRTSSALLFGLLKGLSVWDWLSLTRKHPREARGKKISNSNREPCLGQMSVLGLCIALDKFLNLIFWNTAT